MVHLFGQRREGNKRQAGPRLDLPKIRKNPLVEIIPINSGFVTMFIIQPTSQCLFIFVSIVQCVSVLLYVLQVFEPLYILQDKAC